MAEDKPSGSTNEPEKERSSERLEETDSKQLEELRNRLDTIHGVATPTSIADITYAVERRRVPAASLFAQRIRDALKQTWFMYDERIDTRLILVVSRDGTPQACGVDPFQRDLILRFALNEPSPARRATLTRCLQSEVARFLEKSGLSDCLTRIGNRYPTTDLADMAKIVMGGEPVSLCIRQDDQDDQSDQLSSDLWRFPLLPWLVEDYPDGAIGSEHDLRKMASEPFAGKSCLLAEIHLGATADIPFRYIVGGAFAQRLADSSRYTLVPNTLKAYVQSWELLQKEPSVSFLAALVQLLGLIALG